MKQDCNVYVEHAKLRALDGDNEVIGSFLEWCGEQGWQLATVRDDLTEELECIYCDGSGRWRHQRDCGKCDGTGYRSTALAPQFVTLGLPIPTILAKYFDIDQNRLEEEKRTILEVLRAASDPKLVEVMSTIR